MRCQDSLRKISLRRPGSGEYLTGSRTSCPPAGAARSDLTEESRGNICALRAGGQDVHDPIPQGRGAVSKASKESSRKATAFPNKERQSRYAAFAILPF